MNEGNFCAILKFKAKDLAHLKEFLEAKSRFKYTSSIVQNKIISSCGELILEKIVKEINVFNFSGWDNWCFIEGTILCVRFVSGTGKDLYLREDFSKYIHWNS